MKISIATLTLTVLCLALAAPAFASIFISSGPIDGNNNAFFITGPNNANFLGSFQDISDGFTSAASGTPFSLEFGIWVASGNTPTTVSYEIGTDAFGTELGSGTVALNNNGNSHFLFTNTFGYDIYAVTIPVASSPMTAGNTYWLSLSNANDSGNSGSMAWDIPNGGLGTSGITCNFRQSGTNFGDCGVGGESFTLIGDSAGSPEPGSLLLLGTGLVGIVGVIRRKINL